MDQLFAYLKSQVTKPLTKPLLGAGAVMIAASLGIGISDNPPGVALAYLGLGLVCLSMVHHWKTARDFGTLLAVSVISFPVLVLIHNIFDTLNDKIGTIPVVNQLFGGIAVISFILAVLVVPPLVVIGILGGLYRLLK